MFCFADATGEALAAILRPGNAGANTVTDHLAVLDTAIDQLPDHVAAGHHRGDDEDLVRRAMLVRADSAGCTHGFIWGCRARNVGFAVAARSNASVRGAISRVAYDPDVWARRSPKPVSGATAPRCAKSPTTSTSRTGPKAPG